MKMTTMLMTFGTGVLGAAALGAVTNMVNGAVSPTYFRVVMGWDEIGNVWRASVAQGIFEGSVLGTFLSLLFTGAVFTFAKGQVSYRTSARFLLGIFGCALICWAIGGVLGIALAALSPEMFRGKFIVPPGNTESLLRWAWVGGSIWGLELGGLVGVVMSIVLFRNQHREALSEGTPSLVS